MCSFLLTVKVGDDGRATVRVIILGTVGDWRRTRECYASGLGCRLESNLNSTTVTSSWD